MARYVRNADVEAAPMLEETVLFSPSAKRFCVLNMTAAFVWASLAEPKTAESLAEGLRERFAIHSGADLAGDVRTALSTFESLQLISRVSEA